MLTGGALRSALEKIPPIQLAGRFWRAVTTSSLLGLVCDADGQPSVTRIHPDLLFAGGAGRIGGRYTPIDGPDTLYLASSERAANAEWKAGFLALSPGADLQPKTVFSAQVCLNRVLDLSTNETQESWVPVLRNWVSRGRRGKE